MIVVVVIVQLLVVVFQILNPFLSRTLEMIGFNSVNHCYASHNSVGWLY